MTRGPGFQVAIGDWLARGFARVEAWTAPVPEAVLGLAVLSIAAVFVYATVVDRRRSRESLSTPNPSEQGPDRACIHHSEDPS